jgi:aerobic C4-dicarboxylate transport protein
MLVFGIDKFMSECRALVNFYGNAVATLVIAKWDKTLDIDRARQVLATHTAPDLTATDEPASLPDEGATHRGGHRSGATRTDAAPAAATGDEAVPPAATDGTRTAEPAVR